MLQFNGQLAVLRFKNLFGKMLAYLKMAVLGAALAGAVVVHVMVSPWEDPAKVDEALEWIVRIIFAGNFWTSSRTVPCYVVIAVADWPAIQASCKHIVCRIGMSSHQELVGLVHWPKSPPGLRRSRNCSILQHLASWGFGGVRLVQCASLILIVL